MRILFAAVAVCGLFAAACAHRAPSSRAWTLRGTVIDFNEAELRVRHKSGRIVSLRIDDGTLFTSEGRRAGPDALARNARVSVDVEPLPGGGQRARAVRIVWGGAVPERAHAARRPDESARARAPGVRQRPAHQARPPFASAHGRS